MTTKLNKLIINPEFEDLLAFKSEEEKLEHDAQMISYRVLSAVEKLCDEKKIKKKDLAQLTGTSKSYITQLFNGSKSVNTYIMAKFENIFDATFDVRMKLNEESYDQFISKQMSADLFTKKHIATDEGSWYFCYSKNIAKLNKVSELETESEQKQIAA
ncbi:MAG: helix-turn-helix transcriptional regulator [Chitinophagaceae bacterium]|nr:helix-turn-helix transcriptional regulator [Chitinophagaceae bacterium]